MFSTKIDINGLDWTVKDYPADDDALTLSKGEKCYGMAKYNSLEIAMMEEQADPLYRQTLIHELTHAVLFSYCIPSTKMGEEAVCDFVSAHSQRILDLTRTIMLQRAAYKQYTDKDVSAS